MEERRYCGKNHDEMMKVLDKMCELEDKIELDDEMQDAFDIAIQCITTVMNRMVLDEPIIWD